jgi:hypothetical protein
VWTLQGGGPATQLPHRGLLMQAMYRSCSFTWSSNSFIASFSVTMSLSRLALLLTFSSEKAC